MKMFVANWKMNHAFDETDLWLDVFYRNFTTNSRYLKDLEIVVCPPNILLDYIDTDLMEDSFKYLEIMVKETGKKIEEFSPQQLNEILLRNRPIRLGAQDCHYEDSGSFTGDVSADMLTKVGCEYVILGHCERRKFHHETDEIVAKKVATAVKKLLVPIVCVGETKEIRDAGKHLDFVRDQIMKSLPQNVEFDRLVIAYEPIWSIGTGIIPSSDQINEMMDMIHDVFYNNFKNSTRDFFALYGGSVTSQNSREILAIKNVDGLLIGKASLDAIEFLKICGFNSNLS